MKKKTHKGVLILVISLILAGALFVGFVLLRLFGIPIGVFGYQEGDFYYKTLSTPIMLGIKSNTDTFPVDDVTVKLYYGVYPRGYEPPAASYTHRGDTDIIFGIYTCEYEERENVYASLIFDDYKNIENNIFIKDASKEEVFGGEYWRNMNYWGVSYNHNEDFTIPAEMFTEDYGRFIVKILAFNTNPEYTGYRTGALGYIKVYYQKTDDDTVKLISSSAYYRLKRAQNKTLVETGSGYEAK